MFVTVFLSLYATRLLIVNLGGDKYGLFILFGANISLINILQFSLKTCVQRYLSVGIGSNDSAMIKEYFSSAITLFIILSCGVVVLGILCTPLIFFLFEIPISIGEDIFLIWLLCCINLSLAIISAPFGALFISYQKLNIEAIIGLITTVLLFCSAFCLKYFQNNLLTMYLFFLIVTHLIVIVIYIVFQSKLYPEYRYSFGNNKIVAMKKLLNFGSWSMIARLSNQLRFKGANFVLNPFFGIQMNTSVGIAINLQAYIVKLSQTVLRVINPPLTQAYAAGEREKTQRYTLLLSSVIPQLMMGVSIPLFVDMDTILQLWLGSIPKYSSEFCVLMLSTLIIDRTSIGYASAIFAVGKIKLYTLVYSILSIIVIPISIICFYFELAGPTFILYLGIFFTAIMSVFRVIYVGRKISLKIKSWVKQVIIPLLFINVTAFFIIFLLKGEIPERTIFSIFLSFIFYNLFSTPAAFYCFLSVKERRAVIKYFRSFKGKFI